MSSELQLDVCRLSCCGGAPAFPSWRSPDASGERHEGKAGVVLFAGKTA